jgi:glycosyltransferase involved in cell wall biosynthesis
MADVKVSVVVTTYNHERFAAQAVDSVLAQQTTFCYEILLADDCSTDGTLALLRSYERACPERARVIVSAENRGDQGMRFFGEVVAQCRGDFIAWLDGDDYWTSPDKLQAQADLLEKHPDVSMCFHEVEQVDETGTRVPGRIEPGPGLPEPGIDDLLCYNFVGSCSPMFRRSVLCPLPEWYFKVPWGDWPAYLIAAQHGRIVYLDGGPMGVYRIHPGGAWSGMDVLHQQRLLLRFYDQLQAVLELRHRGRLRERSYASCRGLAGACRERGDWSGALYWTLEAVRRRPLATLAAAYQFARRVGSRRPAPDTPETVHLPTSRRDRNIS